VTEQPPGHWRREGIHREHHSVGPGGQRHVDAVVHQELRSDFVAVGDERLGEREQIAAIEVLLP